MQKVRFRFKTLGRHKLPRQYQLERLRYQHPIKKFKMKCILWAFAVLACAGSAIALKCHRCGWIKDNEVLQLIPVSDERCASDPDPTMLTEVQTLRYPRKFARDHLKQQEANKSVEVRRRRQVITTLDLNARNSSESGEEYTDMTPEGVVTSSSSPRPPVATQKLLDDSEEGDGNFPMYDSLEQASRAPPPSSTAAPPVSRSGKTFNKSPNAIIFDDTDDEYVKIRPVCATWNGMFRGKPFVIRDFHFSEEEGALEGQCFNDIPPQYRTIMEDLFRKDVREAIDEEIENMRYLQIAYCGKDGCNNGDYRKANACPNSPRPVRDDFLKVPKL